MPESPLSDQSPHRHDSPNELFERSLDLLCVAGLDGYFKKVNPSWTRVLGWSAAELLDRPSISFVHPDDVPATLEARARLCKGEPGVRLENRYRCRDGSYRWLAWQSAATRDNGTVFGVARDITEQRQAEQLRQTVTRLESTALFAGGIAHDFNNLLTTLLLSLELVERGGSLTPEQAAHLKLARDATVSAGALTQLLVSLSSGSNQAHETVHLASLLAQAIAETAHHDVTVETDLGAGLPPLLLDRTQILQALKQVLINAAEASPPGAVVRIVAEAETLGAEGPTSLRPGPYVRVRISDSGTGITPENLTRIFDPYFSTKPRGGQKGMGLGLAIAHAVMRKHHGGLTVEPDPSGTTVTLRLPINDPASDADDDKPINDLATLRAHTGRPR